MVESLAVLDRAYASLSHHVRRAMLARLGEGEVRVTDLARPFDISLAAASKHIALLERADLVRRRIDGRDHWISLAPEPLAAAADHLARYRPFWERRLDSLEALMAEPGDE